MLKFCYIFCRVFLLILLLNLGGCAKTEPSTAMVAAIKGDVKVIEKQIENIKKALPAQCQTATITAQIDNVAEQVKSLSTKADSVDLACKTEKEVYTQQISKLRVIIFGLVIACVLLVFIMVKHKIL